MYFLQVGLDSGRMQPIALLSIRVSLLYPNEHNTKVGKLLLFTQTEPGNKFFLFLPADDNKQFRSAKFRRFDRNSPEEAAP